VNTHLLLSEPLSGEVKHDRALVLEALGQGHGWVGYDMPASTRGFKFSGKGKGKGIMGDEIEMDAGATLQVLTPARCDIKLIRHGEVVAEAKNETTLTYVPLEPGAYRVECRIPYLGQQRGWIFSNPIYLK
jgi:hypothetical protein